ncbi:phenolic acid decarboxylase subunit B [Candidatus Methylomirabilis lanthanidiphila]|uniref:Flavin prenyltransferase UbiX n=1 Tax=Candidatus Methylomirabilis lanthanidiphila TaxID=2211376 RepID=A0A564ZLR1_9BACT|nr:UbiX family flavin prenyltransferase [Candidatus Methylomirabilis lanthanidiphila]VUZ86265.1 phenolic acid decarboxylase subunit B [Candidatus Methylomirabilis lanthanidiphila]
MKQIETRQEYILGITGASGVILGVRMLEVLQALSLPVHLIVSEGAKTTLREESGRTVEDLKRLAAFFYDDRDLGASISSGSYVSPNVRAMIVSPCSMKSLAAIATGYAETLIVRAADVVLKEGKRLALVVRESPLTAIHLEQMLILARSGVSIVPPVPPFYQGATTVEGLVDQIVGRVLDQIGVYTDLPNRWRGTG